jgi:multiple sugar transport system substrate-binding protein
MDYLALRSSVYAQQEKANPILTPFIQELVTARSRTQYLGGEYTTYCNDVSVAVQQAILGEATPLAALQSAQKAVEAQAGSNG